MRAHLYRIAHHRPVRQPGPEPGAAEHGRVQRRETEPAVSRTGRSSTAATPALSAKYNALQTEVAEALLQLALVPDLLGLGEEPEQRDRVGQHGVRGRQWLGAHGPLQSRARLRQRVDYAAASLADDVHVPIAGRALEAVSRSRGRPPRPPSRAGSSPASE